jgi:uncharacterized protein involved in outer membrane biogenesis
MSKPGRDRLLAKVLGVAAVVCLLYAAAGFFLAPHLIESRLTRLVDERLGQTLSMEKLKVNPFALSVEATGVRLAQGNGPPMLAARRVYLNLDLLGSGFGRGWVLSEAHSDGLQVQLELQRNGRFNFADLLQRWQQGARPAKPGDTPVRLTVRHLLASDGELTYRKLSGAQATTQVLPIRLELVNVSTLPDREGHYTVSARFVDGGALTWRGDLSLLPMQSEGDLALEGLKLATVWKFIRDDVRLAEPEGALSLASHYKFSYADGKPELGLTGLRVNASALRVVREGFDEPILSLKTLDVRDGNFQLDRRALVLPVVSLGNGSVNVLRDAGGTWNWTGFVREQDSASSTTQPARSPGGDRQAARTWRIDMNAVDVDNVALHYEDRHRPKLLSFETAAMHGKAVVAVIAGGDSLGVLARDMNLRLEKLRLPAADTSAVKLTELRMEGGYVDLSKQTLGATQLVIEGGTLLVERSADGAFPIGESFAGGSETPSTPSPWSYSFDKVRVQGLDVALSDRGFGKQPIAYQLGGVSASFDHIASAGGKPLAFKASARIGSGGSIAASGSAAPDLSSIDARVKLNALALTPLQPFITHYAAVDLASGNASASAVLAYRRTGGKTSFSASGPFELANVRLNEAGSDTTVLAWERLSAGEARLTLGPDRVLIKEIVVEAPEAKIDISEQRELNLLQLFKHEPTPGNQNRQPTNGDAKESQFPVHIGELRVRDGTMDFSDRSLVLPFSTQVTNLSGTAAGLGTNPERRATLQFEGDIGESGSAEITGSVDASSPKTFTEINVAFQNVELPDLSPYSVTFLGRKIASGKLWVNLKYGIENSQLTGNNDITIHDLRLGEPVESPTALKLPLDLAVALLTDSEGKIRTVVPVKGDLNNPKFDLGAVIREALGNLIVKIVSAPFRALAGLFGNSRGKDFGSVEFEPGSARLLASEKEKLQEVAKAMRERPQLKLVVHAPYARETDREAMKQEMASRDVALALGRSLQPGEKPGPVVFESLATQRALERLLAKKADAGVVRELAAQHARRTGEEPKRASLLVRKTGDPDFYKSMYAWLVEAQPIGDASVEDLAASRANVVLEALRSAGADPDRLAPGPVEASKHEEGKRISAELSLEAVGRQHSAASRKAPAVAQVSR